MPLKNMLERKFARIGNWVAFQALWVRALECWVLWWGIAFSFLCWHTQVGFHCLILFMEECMLKLFFRAAVVRELHCLACLWYKLKKKNNRRPKYFVCAWGIFKSTYFIVNLKVFLLFYIFPSILKNYFLL